MQINATVIAAQQAARQARAALLAPQPVASIPTDLNSQDAPAPDAPKAAAAPAPVAQAPTRPGSLLDIKI